MWRTPKRLLEPAQLEELAALCASVPEDATRYGWQGSPGSLGASWLYGSMMHTYYNHVLAPGHPSCINNSKVQEGVYTANSLHPGGVPAWTSGDPTIEFDFPDTSRTGQRLGFEGTVKAESAAVRPSAIMVRIERHDSQGNMVFFNAGVGCACGDEPDATYSIALQGPKDPGEYDVLIGASGAELPAEAIMVKGTLTVRGEP